jgi:integrase
MIVSLGGYMAIIIQRSGAWHLRLYSCVDIQTGEPFPMGKQGPKNQRPKRLRKQQSVLIARCDDNQFKTAKSTGTLLRANELHTQILRWETACTEADRISPPESKPETVTPPPESGAPDGSMLVSTFFKDVFLPQMKVERTPSTYNSYRRYFRAYLEPHWNHTMTLKSYAPFMATNLLESLAGKCATNTVRHVRSVAQTIFGYAVAKGYISMNPWKDARQNITCKKAKPTIAYTAEEVEKVLDILSNVSGRMEESAKTAGMLLALCYYGGLRPSEACGLRFESIHFATNEMLIREVFVEGQFKGTTKTDEVRTVQIVSPLRKRLEVWRKEWRHGLILPNRDGDKPINANDASNRIIKKAIDEHTKKTGEVIRWTGMYAGRRGFATVLREGGVDSSDISAAMGNSKAIVDSAYVRERKVAAKRAIDAWEKFMAAGAL